jgi:cell division septation protein DedD
MLKYIFRFLFIIIFITFSCSYIKAQEERKVSLSIYGGVALYPKSKINPANLPIRALGGFNPSPVLGLGAFYRLSKRMQIGESYMYLFGAQSHNRNMSSHTFRTSLKYYILTDKKIKPYISAGININLVNLNRKGNEYNYVPDPGASNVIGNGITVDSIFYREQPLKLQRMPVLGASIGAGFDFKISKKIDLFIQYDLHENLGKNNKLMEQYYYFNQSNFVFHTVTAGVNIKLFKPQKQLLATLDRDDWKNSKPIDVKGTIIYKNPAKPYKKPLQVEKTDTLEAVLEVDPTDENAMIFFSKGIELGDYQFMLPKKHRKIIRADLQILNYNRIEIEDEELELDMVEDEGSENILSRDANFAVLLREGFQHEIELATTAENIMGTFVPSDTNCRVRITLRDQYDSIIATVDTLENNKFNFVDVGPGNYKMTFQRLNDNCKQTEFTYAFNGSTPYVKRQSNTNEPEDTTATYSINGNVSTDPAKLEAPKGTVVKLIDPSGRVEQKTTLGGAKAGFDYKKLNSPDYSTVYEDPTDKASMAYKVKDNKSTIIREVNQGPVKKATKGDIVVKGKIELPNPEQVKTVNVMLVDGTGKVKQKVPVSPDGSFSFDNLAKDKYKVVYESTDPIVRAKLNYTTIDKSFKIVKITLPELTATIERIDTVHFSKKPELVKDTTSLPEKNVVVTDPVKIPEKDTSAIEKVPVKIPEKDLVIAKDTTTTKIPEKKVPKTKEVPIRYPYAQFKPGTTYNDLGYEARPEGYGVQVSSFFINSNLEKFCQRVRAKGEKNIFIQVIPKDKNNPDSGLIYRVIIGADKDRDKMNKKIPVYMDKGYDAVLRKHLDPVVSN